MSVQGLPLTGIRDTPNQGWNAVAKRAIDIAGSLFLLILFGFPLLILSVLVKVTSPGPVLFRQKRVGLGEQPFTILKFRSMRVEAERETGPIWAQEGDPRRTPLGVLMRRLSLDELPQLINVLRGDMSLVGPRPERPHFLPRLAQQSSDYTARHSVKPGITGWAQVNGLRGNTSIEKRLEYDLYYITNWSLRFDLLILLLTPFVGLRGKNAY